jgi:hypothetical protein
LTAQEIFDRQGYLILARTAPAEIGQVLTIERDNDLAPKGTQVVVRDTATLAEARRYAKKYGIRGDPGKWPYLYKVVAE